MWSSVLEVERIRAVLEGSFTPWGLDYSIDCEMEYQLARKRLLAYLAHPCFTETGWAMDALPPTLGDWASWDGSMWLSNSGGQAAIVALQGDVIRALIESGIPRPSAQEQTQPNTNLALAMDAGGAPLTVPERLGQSHRLVKATGTRGRPRIKISSGRIAETFWAMKDERIGTPDAMIDPTQRDVCDRLTAEGQRISPATLKKNLTEEGIPWPPPRPTDDDLTGST